MRPVNRDGDFIQQPAPSYVFVGISGRREVVMVGQKKAVAAVRANCMVNLAIPEWVRYVAVAIIVALRTDCLDAPNPDDEPRNAFSERLTFLAIEEDKRSLRREMAKESGSKRFLARGANHP